MAKEAVKPKRKKSSLEAIEFSTVKHKGKTLKMLGEFAPGWRPKTRPKDKLRLNMKKLLNPHLNVEGVTILDELSSDEKAESKKLIPKMKKTTAAKASPGQPAQTKKSVQSIEESIIT